MICGQTNSIYGLRNTEKKTIKNKEQLIKMLKGYKKILSNEILEYLNYAIELEFPIFKNNIIKESDQKRLAELNIYKEIEKYNIYYRALNLFEKEKENFPIIINKDNTSLSVKSKDNNFDIFDYCDYFYGNIITIYTLEQDIKKRQERINEIESKLELLKTAINPYSYNKKSEKEMGTTLLNGLGYTWRIEQEQKIEDLKDSLKKLKKIKGLSQDEQKQATIQKYFSDLILNDYGFTSNKVFKEEKNNKYQEPNIKVLKKSLPNIDIERHIEII